jgi:predicted DNA-binding transcriptional regulator AlpA
MRGDFLGAIMNIDELKLLRVKDILQLLNISNATFYRKIREGLITKPVKITRGMVGLPTYEVEQIYKAMLTGKDEFQIAILVDELMEKRKKDIDGFQTSRQPIDYTKLELVEA